MRWVFFFSFFVLNAIFAHADIQLSHSLVSGNVLLTPQSIQKIVQNIIVNKLQKNYLVQNKTTGLIIQVEPLQLNVKIPQKPLLQDILKTLGIQDQIQIFIDQIQTSINFENDSLKIKIEKVGDNRFKILAHWEIKKLVAESKSLKIAVPKGAFDQSFEIISQPVKISLNPEFGPISASLKMTADLSNNGSKISLDHFVTNLNDGKPRLKMELGPLTVNGKPLALEIDSNGETLVTDEPTIRTQFQNFEPQLMKSVQEQLGNIIQTKFTEISDTLQKQDPFKFSIESNEILDKYSFHNSSIDSLFRNISSNLVLSYIQELPKQKLFTTQISSEVCIASECLTNLFNSSEITNEDSAEITGSDGGMIIYESWIQNIINSAPFQKRIAELYKNSLHQPGVSLGSDGIKIHFDSGDNAIIVVLNLKIDIKATANNKNIFNSWSQFLDYSEKQLADVWENIAGSGQYVYLPVEITANINGIKLNAEGKKYLELRTSIPFYENGTISNRYDYQCNVQNMNAKTRGMLLSSVKNSISASIPTEIKISLENNLEFQGIKFGVNQVKITPHHGLLISGDINE